MMANLIDQDAAMEIVKRTSGDYAAAWSMLRKLPAVDAEPVRHGRWIEHFKRPCSTMFDCSECGGIAYDAQKNRSQPKRCSYHYCPNCGAKMDTEED